MNIPSRMARKMAFRWPNEGKSSWFDCLWDAIFPRNPRRTNGIKWQDYAYSRVTLAADWQLVSQLGRQRPVFYVTSKDVIESESSTRTRILNCSSGQVKDVNSLLPVPLFHKETVLHKRNKKSLFVNKYSNAHKGTSSKKLENIFQ